MNDATTKQTTLTVGLDVGDRYVQVRVLDAAAMKEPVAFHTSPGKRLAARDGIIALNLPPYAMGFLDEGSHS